MPFSSSSESLLQNKSFIHKRVYANSHLFSTVKGNIIARISCDIITKYKRSPFRLPLHREG